MSSIIRPGEVTGPVPEIPLLHLPERGTVFARRAARLRHLGEGHSLGDYLRFLALVTDAQQAALGAHPAVPLPDDRERRLCREHGLPPVSATGWRRAEAWRGDLAAILTDLAGHPLPGAAAEAVARLQSSPHEVIEDQAERILAAEPEGLDATLVPLVAAGLQVYWTHLTSALGAEALVRLDPPHLCPACGSRPVASVVRVGGAEQGLRYLACPLCALQWHLVRAKCVVCDSSRALGYYAIEGGSGAVKAEACDDCHRYVKIGYMEKDTGIEPIADDLATLALDLLVNDAGYARFGVNPLFVPGPLEPPALP